MKKLMYRVDKDDFELDWMYVGKDATNETELHIFFDNEIKARQYALKEVQKKLKEHQGMVKFYEFELESSKNIKLSLETVVQALQHRFPGNDELSWYDGEDETGEFYAEHILLDRSIKLTYDMNEQEYTYILPEGN